MTRSNYLKAFIGIIFFIIISLFFIFPVYAAEEDRVYFFTPRTSADIILIETNGHFGLIDSADRENSQLGTYDLTKYGMKGSDGVLFKSIGGKSILNNFIMSAVAPSDFHLDFIIATHSHSDHVGGFPEIFDLKNKNNKDIIDSNTIYFYKPYISDGKTSVENNDWLNNQFHLEALNKAKSKGAKTIDISKGKILGGNQPALNYSNELNLINSNYVITNANYINSTNLDWLDDKLYFTFGDYTIYLYNLFSINSNEENSNSICTLIKKNDTEIVTCGDQTTIDNIDKKLANIITGDISGRLEVWKANHHGATVGNNSKITLETYKPQNIIQTGVTSTLESTGDWANVIWHTKDWGTKFYPTGLSGELGAIVVDVTNSLEIKKYNNIISNVSGLIAKDIKPTNNAFLRWTYEFHDLSNNTAIDWRYFKDDIALTGWNKLTWGGKTNDFYFFPNGLLAVDQYIDGHYVDENGRYWSNESANYKPKKEWKQYGDKWKYETSSNDYCVGWTKINDLWYYFDSSGYMANGWNKAGTENNWYYFGTIGNVNSGYALKGWQKIDNKWYYFGYPWDEDSRFMRTGWIQVLGKWYYLNPSGDMATGWKKVNNDMYYLEDTGEMITGKKIISNIEYTFDNTGRYTPSVTFKDGNTVLKTQVVNYNGTAVPPANPVKKGYVFVGWDKSLSNITNETIIFAKWEREINIKNYTNKAATIACGGTSNIDFVGSDTNIKITSEKPCVVIANNKRLKGTTEHVFNIEDSIETVEVYLLGDINNNGIVNVSDSTLINRHCLNANNKNYRKLSAKEQLIADINNSNTINVSDATLLNRMLLSKTNKLYKLPEW